jgi:LmbE family N-acetylglucosaminyl deacetylase
VSIADVVFYVSGHPDDALLFRGDVLYADLHSADGIRVVHVVTTAGDAGRTDGWWQAREQGSVDAFQATLSPDRISSGLASINGRPVQRYTTPRWSCYFLRLPDGNLDNTGFPSTGGRTLARLQSGAITTLATVDGSTTYNGWASFTTTLQAILAEERQGTATLRPWVNASDFDRAANPGDHPDHYATAEALRSFVTSGYNRAWWVAYDVRNRPANINRLALESKRFLFYSYGYAVQERSGILPNDTEWEWWGPKRYERLETT